MWVKCWVYLLATVAALVTAARADCGPTWGMWCAAACRSACAPCVQYQTVERTVMVPTYVTEMREIKHPYKSGIRAQPGIEF